LKKLLKKILSFISALEPETKPFLVIVPENETVVKPGDRLKVMMLNWSGKEF
jgi:hypothetical protein